jgi:hypothetical protein
MSHVVLFFISLLCHDCLLCMTFEIGSLYLVAYIAVVVRCFEELDVVRPDDNFASEITPLATALPGSLSLLRETECIPAMF